jgi:hypothetical protein
MNVGAKERLWQGVSKDQIAGEDRFSKTGVNVFHKSPLGRREFGAERRLAGFRIAATGPLLAPWRRPLPAA